MLLWLSWGQSQLPLDACTGVGLEPVQVSSACLFLGEQGFFVGGMSQQHGSAQA